MNKIAHYIPEFLPLTARWIYDQLINDSEQTSEVITYSNTKLFTYSNIREIQKNIFQKIITLIGRTVLGFDPYLYTALKNSNPQILHAHFGCNGIQLMKIKKLLNIPLVVSFYGYDILQPLERPELKRKYRHLFAAADLILCEGEYAKNILIDQGADSKKTKVLHLGVETTNTPQKDLSKLPQEINILIASSFVEKKGIRYALEGIGKFSKQYSGKINIHLVGDYPSHQPQTTIKNNIEKTIAEYSLAKKIIQYGYVSNQKLTELMSKCEILISSSVLAPNGDIEGGFPVTVTQAMANGMLVIGSYHADYPEIITPGINGFLTPERRPESIKDTLLKIVKTPEAELHKITDQAKLTVKQSFSISGTQKKLTSYYSELR